jgi:hypothetical protein
MNRATSRNVFGTLILAASLTACNATDDSVPTAPRDDSAPIGGTAPQPGGSGPLPTEPEPDAPAPEEPAPEPEPQEPAPELPQDPEPVPEPEPPQEPAPLPEEPPVDRSAMLTWDSPTMKVDGSCLSELAGYRIEYGLSPGVYTESVTIAAADLAATGTGETGTCGEIYRYTYTLEDLGVASWFFAVRAIDGEGSSSERSNEVIKTIY